MGNVQVTGSSTTEKLLIKKLPFFKRMRVMISRWVASRPMIRRFRKWLQTKFLGKFVNKLFFWRK